MPARRRGRSRPLQDDGLLGVHPSPHQTQVVPSSGRHVIGRCSGDPDDAGEGLLFPRCTLFPVGTPPPRRPRLFPCGAEVRGNHYKHSDPQQSSFRGCTPGDTLTAFVDVVALNNADYGFRRFLLDRFLSMHPRAVDELILLLKARPDTTARLQFTVTYEQNGPRLDEYTTPSAVLGAD